MKRSITKITVTLILSAIVGACGGGGGGGGGGTTLPPPADQNPDGVWGGQAVTGASDVVTGFEFNATGPFSVGTSPFTATFSSGVAESRGDGDLYSDGVFAWHVLNLTTATVTFETPPSTLKFSVRTEFASDVSDIQILDDVGNTIMSVTPTGSFRQIVVTRAPGETFIGSFVVTSTSGGDVIIDGLSFGFPSTTDNISCLVAETLEFVCIITDVATDEFVAGVNGTVQVNGAQVTGSATLHAASGTTLPDGSTIANVTIGAGTVSERVSLDLTAGTGGFATSVSTTFDNSYNRGSDLATVGAVYSLFDIFGDMSSFAIDAVGVITGQSNSGCVLNGQVAIIDAMFNAYDVTLDVASCGGLDGMYDGLGSSQDGAAMDDLFLFAVFTAQSVIVGEAEK